MPGYPYIKLRAHFLSLAAALLFSVANTAWAGSNHGDNNNDERERYNVVMVIVNSLRADHLGCYGYRLNTSPNIDRLAGEGVLFERAIAQSHWTLPSLISIFTSKYVSAHNVTSRDAGLGQGEKTLAQILSAHGYRTAAFTCGLDTAEVYGLGKGFDVYNVYSRNGAVGSFSDAIPRAVKWLSKNKDKDFFLFLHSYDTHPPYRDGIESNFNNDYRGVFTGLPLDYSTFREIEDYGLYLGGRRIDLGAEDIKYIVAFYDERIRRVDRFIGLLVDKLKRIKLYDKTIIILCADHGEELGERGSFDRFDKQNLYQEVVRVPLVIYYPLRQSKGRRINSLVELVDIMPTVLDLLEIPGADGLQGRSLASFLESVPGAPVRKYAFSEASLRKWAILRDDGWKLLYSPQKEELYNTNDDPLERDNLSGQRSEVEVSLMKEFFLWRQRHSRETGADNYIKLDSQLIESLKKAGYW